MKMRLTRLIVFLALISACREASPPLAPEKMGRVLLDMHLAEAYAQQIPRPEGQISMRNEDSLKVFQARILNKHGISESAFRNATNWYTSHPEMLDSVYQNILSEITILAAKENK
jgi:hypothetical protein